MKKMTQEYLNRIVICPVCKQERRQGEMMCGTNKPICSHCYKEKGALRNEHKKNNTKGS